MMRELKALRHHTQRRANPLPRSFLRLAAMGIAGVCLGMFLFFAFSADHAAALDVTDTVEEVADEAAEASATSEQTSDSVAVDEHVVENGTSSDNPEPQDTDPAPVQQSLDSEPGGVTNIQVEQAPETDVDTGIDGTGSSIEADPTVDVPVQASDSNDGEHGAETNPASDNGKAIDGDSPHQNDDSNTKEGLTDVDAPAAGDDLTQVSVDADTTMEIAESVDELSDATAATGNDENPAGAVDGDGDSTSSSEAAGNVDVKVNASIDANAPTSLDEPVEVTVDANANASIDANVPTSLDEPVEVADDANADASIEADIGVSTNANIEGSTGGVIGSDPGIYLDADVDVTLGDPVAIDVGTQTRPLPTDADAGIDVPARAQTPGAFPDLPAEPGTRVNVVVPPAIDVPGVNSPRTPKLAPTQPDIGEVVVADPSPPTGDVPARGPDPASGGPSTASKNPASKVVEASPSAPTTGIVEGFESADTLLVPDRAVSNAAVSQSPGPIVPSTKGHFTPPEPGRSSTSETSKASPQSSPRSQPTISVMTPANPVVSGADTIPLFAAIVLLTFALSMHARIVSMYGLRRLYGLTHAPATSPG